MPIALFKMNVKSIYKKSTPKHTLLKDAVDFVASEIEWPADVVIVGPPTGGDDSDVELIDDEDLTENDTLPAEVAGEMEVLFFLKKKKKRKKLKFNHPKKRAKKKKMKQIRNGKSLYQ